MIFFWESLQISDAHNHNILKSASLLSEISKGYKEYKHAKEYGYLRKNNLNLCLFEINERNAPVSFF